MLRQKHTTTQPSSASSTASVSPSHRPASRLAQRQGTRGERHTSERQAADSINTPTAASSARRRELLSAPGAVVLAWACTAAAQGTGSSVEQLQADAYEAYANREFQTAVQKLTDILQQDPNNPRWLEMRAQVLVDGKNFQAAIRDFDTAFGSTAAEQPVTLARLYAGRALAFEGISEWRKALDDYNQALDLAQQAGESPDPYIINSLGNCHNSLQEWDTARECYLVSSQLFQQAKGFRGRGGTTTQRLDGAIYAASNAALMLVQMGDEQAALKEFERISRRAPGSVDTRAALAALYWRDGRVEQAEDVWNFACESISAGCRLYQDSSWLATVRRWPPKMVSYLQDFLALKQAAGGGSLLAG